jgi:hypothetical protein
MKMESVMRAPLFAAAAVAMFVATSPAIANHDDSRCKWCRSERPNYRIPICRTVREPIAIRHGYVIYLTREFCH